MSTMTNLLDLRAKFVDILDIETGDGACALSLLDEVINAEQQSKPTLAFFPEISQEIVEVEVTDLAEHVADMNDMMLEMIMELNKRVKILESK